MKKAQFLFLLILLGSLSIAQAKDKESITRWLGRHELKFANCHPEKTSESYRLCDGTIIAQKELKTLFSYTPTELVNFIRSKKINLQIFCRKTKDNKKKKGLFDSFCLKNLVKKKEFQKISYLHGQYKPETNTIFLNSDASLGSLIHEYIHYLQYINKNLIYGRRYKFERMNIQKNIVKKMDKIIYAVKRIEESQTSQNNKTEFKKYMNQMLSLSEELKRFSKWQDLIDERSIFELYKIFGKDFNLPKADRDLAAKNLSFICKRKDLFKKFDAVTCEDNKVVKKDSKKYYRGIKALIKEIRPIPNFTLIDKFLENVPKINANESLISIIAKINKYIFVTWKMKPDISYISRKQKDNILPDTTLELRKAHCVGLSALYLLAMEKMGVKSSFVRLPTHVLIRACKNNQCLNIETLKKGKQTQISDYIAEGIITKEAIYKEGLYFKSLNSFQDLASSLYLSLGYIAGDAKQWGVAELMYKKSIDSSRGFSEAYSNLASVYSSTGKIRQSKTYLNISQKINPFHAGTQLNLGILASHHKKPEKARQFYNKAMKLRPNFVKAYILSAKLYESKGMSKEALLDYKKAVLIAPQACQSINNLEVCPKNE